MAWECLCAASEAAWHPGQPGTLVKVGDTLYEHDVQGAMEVLSARAKAAPATLAAPLEICRLTLAACMASPSVSKTSQVVLQVLPDGDVVLAAN